MGGWVGGGREGGSNALLDLRVLGGWVGGWVGGKEFGSSSLESVGFIGTGAIGKIMAQIRMGLGGSSNRLVPLYLPINHPPTHPTTQGAAVAHKFKQGYAYGLDPAMSASFAQEIEAELGYPVKVSLSHPPTHPPTHHPPPLSRQPPTPQQPTAAHSNPLLPLHPPNYPPTHPPTHLKVCATAEEAVRASDVLFTQTPGSKPVLELSWLKPHATIIASGSDQPTKNEIPPEVYNPPTHPPTHPTFSE